MVESAAGCACGEGRGRGQRANRAQSSQPAAQKFSSSCRHSRLPRAHSPAMPQQMPFMLHVYPSAAFADGRAAHLPWLQEMPDPMTTVMWGSWVEINPETAHKLDIHEGDVLTITSPQGSIELPAFLYPGSASRRDCDPGRSGPHAVRPLRGESRREPAAAVRLDARSGDWCGRCRLGVRVSVAKTGRQREADSVRRQRCSRTPRASGASGLGDR